MSQVIIQPYAGGSHQFNQTNLRNGASMWRLGEGDGSGGWSPPWPIKYHRMTVVAEVTVAGSPTQTFDVTLYKNGVATSILSVSQDVSSTFGTNWFTVTDTSASNNPILTTDFVVLEGVISSSSRVDHISIIVDYEYL